MQWPLGLLTFPTCCEHPLNGRAGCGLMVFRNPLGIVGVAQLIRAPIFEDVFRCSLIDVHVPYAGILADGHIPAPAQGLHSPGPGNLPGQSGAGSNRHLSEVTAAFTLQWDLHS